MGNVLKKMMGQEQGENPHDYKSLIMNMENTKYEISELDASLDYVTDPILMNQIIFQRKAAEMRYRYWYKLAKENKISAQ